MKRVEEMDIHLIFLWLENILDGSFCGKCNGIMEF